MAHSVLSADRFHNEEAAFEWVEKQLWPNGPVCPHCGNADASKIGRLNGKTTRPGLRKCYACRKPFTVRMGTIFEDSHLPLRLWLQAIHLMVSSKKGISTRQLQRTLGCGMKTAWHLGHRIRWAMDPSAAGPVGPMGGTGETVEADDTAITNSQKTRRTESGRKRPKMQVLSLVERGGNVRSFLIDEKNVRDHVWEQIHRDSRLVTDMGKVFAGSPVAKHETVDHSKFEWARGDVHTNSLEGFFSIFKRGLIGVYQRVEKRHVHRYLAEFDFRQNTRERLGINDVERSEIAVQNAKGKRLTYETTL